MSSCTPPLTNDQFHTGLHQLIDEETQSRKRHQHVPNFGPRYSALDHAEFSWDQNQSQGWDGSSVRNLYKGAMKVVLSRLSNDWLAGKRTVVEIGSGALDPDYRSYFSSALPAEVAQKVIHTDADPTVATGRVRKIKVVDLNDTLGRESVDAAVACCALDCIRLSELPLALRSISEALRPGGVLISFSDLPPFLPSVCNDLIKLGLVLFPWNNPFGHGPATGVQAISPEDLRSYVADRSEDMLPVDQKLLLRYANLDPALSESVLCELGSNGSELRRIVGLSLSHCIARLKIPGMRKVDPSIEYRSRLRSGLADVGMETVQFGYLSASEIRKFAPAEDQTHNYFISNDTIQTRHKIYVLKPGNVCYHLHAHVVIARKR